MATLAQIFGNIKEDCYMDTKGVYKDGEKVALDNTHNVAYTRRNGERSLEKLGNYVYRVEQPMRLVCSVPGATVDSLERAAINALDQCDYVITASYTDRIQIAQEELIEEQELTKFHDIAIVAIDYIKETTELNDEDCDITLC